MLDVNGPQACSFGYFSENLNVEAVAVGFPDHSLESVLFGAGGCEPSCHLLLLLQEFGMFSVMFLTFKVVVTVHGSRD